MNVKGHEGLHGDARLQAIQISFTYGGDTKKQRSASEAGHKRGYHSRAMWKFKEDFPRENTEDWQAAAFNPSGNSNFEGGGKGWANRADAPNQKRVREKSLLYPSPCPSPSKRTVCLQGPFMVRLGLTRTTPSYLEINYVSRSSCWNGTNFESVTPDTPRGEGKQFCFGPKYLK